MKKGNAPEGKDGNPVQLHHIAGKEPGPMLEIQQKNHNKGSNPTLFKNLHFFINDRESFRQDEKLKRQYENFRRSYWKNRARVICKK